MSRLRFAIIKHIRTQLGDNWEDVVFEYQEDRVFRELLENFITSLPKTKFYKSTFSSEEISAAFEEAWEKTVNDFKEVTVTIF